MTAQVGYSTGTGMHMHGYAVTSHALLLFQRGQVLSAVFPVCSHAGRPLGTRWVCWRANARDPPRSLPVRTLQLLPFHALTLPLWILKGDQAGVGWGWGAGRVVWHDAAKAKPARLKRAVCPQLDQNTFQERDALCSQGLAGYSARNCRGASVIP